MPQRTRDSQFINLKISAWKRGKTQAVPYYRTAAGFYDFNAGFSDDWTRYMIPSGNGGLILDRIALNDTITYKITVTGLLYEYRDLFQNFGPSFESVAAAMAEADRILSKIDTLHIFS